MSPEIYTIQQWKAMNKRTVYLDIWNSFTRHFYQETFSDFKEDVLDYYFGKGRDIPLRYLSFTTKNGDVVGYAGLSDFNGDVKTWRVDYGIKPQYFDKGLPQILINSAIRLAHESNIPKINPCKRKNIKKIPVFIIYFDSAAGFNRDSFMNISSFKI